MHDGTLPLSAETSQALALALPAAHHASGWLDAREEQRLILALQSGDRHAGNRLVRSHLPLVQRIARGYRLWGADLDDLVQQGCIGLLKAALKFDPARAHCLRTYAAYWIRAEIREHVVRTYRIVRLGTTRTERKALRAYRARDVESPAALAELSGMPLARCEQLWPLITRRDTHVDDDAAGGLDRVAQERLHPETLLAHAQEHVRRHAQVHAALATLSVRERHIAQMRLMSDEPRTLEALGHELGLSRERVRQLEVAIKSKLRAHLIAGETSPFPLPAGKAVGAPPLHEVRSAHATRSVTARSP